MNLAEFNALKIGDKVENAMTNGEGTVSAVYEARTGKVVSVRWGAAHPPHGNLTFAYHSNSTAWFHWNTVAPAVGGEFSCACGRGDKPCPGPDGKPLCFVRDRINST